MWIIRQEAIIIQGTTWWVKRFPQEAILQQLHQGSRREWHYQPLAQGYTNSLLKPSTSFDPTADFQGCIEPIWQMQERQMPKLSVDHLIERFLTLNADFQLC